MRHSWLKYFHSFHDLESNPQTQLKIHVWGQRFWLANVPVFVYVFIKFPGQFLSFGVLITGLYSLYANWSTDNGAAASIKADLHTRPSNAEIMTALGHELAPGEFEA